MEEFTANELKLIKYQYTRGQKAVCSIDKKPLMIKEHKVVGGINLQIYCPECKRNGTIPPQDI
jgi:ribosomal protein L44E